MKKVILTIALAGFAGVTVAADLPGLNRTGPSVQTVVGGAEFDDSVGEAGAFMTPDVCSNIWGYQGTAPSGYAVVDGECVAPCQAPDSVSSNVAEVCPLGMSGNAIRSSRTDYSCPTTYGPPASSTTTALDTTGCGVAMDRIQDYIGKWTVLSFHVDPWTGAQFRHVLRFVDVNNVQIDHIVTPAGTPASRPYSELLTGSGSLYAFTEDGLRNFSRASTTSRLNCAPYSSGFFCYGLDQASRNSFFVSAECSHTDAIGCNYRNLMVSITSSGVYFVGSRSIVNPTSPAYRLDPFMFRSGNSAGMPSNFGEIASISCEFEAAPLYTRVFYENNYIGKKINLKTRCRR